jgi:hypothetical protein
LIASGIGSWLTGRLSAVDAPRAGPPRFLALLLLLAAFAAAAPALLHALGGLGTPLRIAAAVALLAPLGVLMGMPFPLGMQLAAQRWPASTPWLWGINGATSVCGSVAAMVLALQFGIGATLWAGITAYGVAAVAFWRASHATAPQRQPAAPARAGQSA